MDPIHLDFFASLDHLASRLNDIDPELPNHMRAIHKNLRQYDELAHLLSDEQIRLIIQSEKKHTSIELVKITSKTKKPKVKGFDLEEL